MNNNDANPFIFVSVSCAGEVRAELRFHGGMMTGTALVLHYLEVAQPAAVNLQHWSRREMFAVAGMSWFEAASEILRLVGEYGVDAKTAEAMGAPKAA